MKKINFLMISFVLVVDIFAKEEFSKMTLFLDQYCYSCHDDDVQKGNVQLNNINELKLSDRLELLNNIQEQLYIGEMPPRKKKLQPSDKERAEAVKLILEELKKNNASKFEEKLRRPDFGNYVNHEKLFSGEYAHLEAYTPNRRWMVCEFIFDNKIARIMGKKGVVKVNKKQVPVIGKNKNNTTNPFLLPKGSGVRYYANTQLSSGHLLTMISNSKLMADSIVELYKLKKENIGK